MFLQSVVTGDCRLKTELLLESLAGGVVEVGRCPGGGGLALGRRGRVQARLRDRDFGVEVGNFLG